METFITWLSLNHWFLVIAGLASIAGFLGVPLAVLFYFKAQRTRQPKYSYRTFSIVSGTQKLVPELSMRFQGHEGEINDLSSTTFTFWNHGKEAIRKHDVTGPIRFILSTGNILRCTIVATTTPENNFRVSTDENKQSMEVDFDYVDSREGAAIQLLHTAPWTSEFRVEGTIIGAKLKPWQVSDLPLTPFIHEWNPKFLWHPLAVILHLAAFLGLPIAVTVLAANLFSLVLPKLLVGVLAAIVFFGMVVIVGISISKIASLSKPPLKQFVNPYGSGRELEIVQSIIRKLGP